MLAGCRNGDAPGLPMFSLRFSIDNVLQGAPPRTFLTVFDRTRYGSRLRTFFNVIGWLCP